MRDEYEFENMVGRPNPYSGRLNAADREPIQLSERDQIAFAEALLNPPKPSEAIVKAALRYLEEAGATDQKR